MPTIEQNKQAVLRFINALAGDESEGTVAELVTEDFVIDTRAPTLSLFGPARLDKTTNMVRLMKTLMPDGITFQVKELTAEADRVSCIAEGKANLVDGRTYNNYYHWLFYLSDGKICTLCEYFDSKLVEQTFGNVPKG